MVSLPRLVIAAAASSAGKTTLATGLMGALRAAGHDVAGFKVGPDFIDPGYHALATGRPGRNLDAVLTSPDLIPGLLLHGAGAPSRATPQVAPPRSSMPSPPAGTATPAGTAPPPATPPVPRRGPGGTLENPSVRPVLDSPGPASTDRAADVAIIEGVMGLFDGQLGRDGFGSTAHVATLIDAPILLVVDAAGSSRTAAAAALGLRGFGASGTASERGPGIAGVVVNRVSSPRHGSELAAVFAAAGLPVLGMVPRNADIAAPSRHLGLVPATERRESAATVEALSAHIAEFVDLDAVLSLARSAADLSAAPWNPTTVVTPVSGRPLIGLMAGRAFTFRYAETEELLRAAGCQVVEIDPLVDEGLPAGLAGLYIGGGFPEIHAVELSRNASLRGAIAAGIASGLPTVAECAGQLYLGEHLDGHPMVGAIPATARMTPRLSLGYRSATAPADTLLAARGTTVSGHEFHRTLTTPASGAAPAWSWLGHDEGFSADPAGVGEPTLHTSYLHLHWAGRPDCAQRFADAAARFVAGDQQRPGGRPRPARRTAAPSAASGTRVDGIDLDHHGDRDIAPGLVDLAVNIQPGPPAWLADEVQRTIAGLAAYPDATEARVAIAEAHGVPPEMVLPTAGGAEAFALIARTLCGSGSPIRHPLVVHPQFTETEAALRAVGAAVQRWLLPVTTALGAPPLTDLPAWADAVFVGNPTNPTGWLHRRDDLLEVSRGRLLVVDEAFMDSTDEHESLICPTMPNRLVVRSLSKTWGLAGLRVGYVVGDPLLVARLARAQPPWPVSAPAIAAMVVTSSAAALAQAADHYVEVDRHREYLAGMLAGAGFPTVPSRAPFVLIDTSGCGPASIRAALAEAGFAVRRGESFPGLGPTWIRVKVPAPDLTDRFVSALVSVRAGVRGAFGADGDGERGAPVPGKE